MDNPQLSQLESLIQPMAETIAIRKGLPKDFIISIVDNEEIIKLTRREFSFIVKRAQIPSILINRQFLYKYLEKFLTSNNKNHFLPIKESLERCLEKLPRMTYSLSNLNGPELLALDEIQRKFIKVIPKESESSLQEIQILKNEFFQVSICVKDLITNTEFSTPIVDIHSVGAIVRDFKIRLSRMILESDENLKLLITSKSSNLEEVSVMVEDDGTVREGLIHGE